MKRHICAMSRAQKAIYNEVEAASKQIDEHIIKLLLYSDAEERRLPSSTLHVFHYQQAA